MIELIITLAILSFGIIGVYGAFIPAVTLTYNLSSRFTAAYLAQEGLEIARNIRDNNFVTANPWANSLTSCTTGCQADYTTGTDVVGATPLSGYGSGNFLTINSDGLYGYNAGTATKFKRKITTNQDFGQDTLRVDVEVTWDYNGQTLSFEAEEYLYNWH